MIDVACPVETCASIVNGLKTHGTDVSKNELESKISCDFDATYPSPPPVDYDDSGWGFAGFLILLIIIIIAIALYMYYAANNNSNNIDNNEHLDWL